MRFLASIILFIAAVGLFFGYTDSAYDAVQALRVENRTFDEAFKRLGALEERRDALLAEYSALGSEDIEDLRKLLPDHVDNVRLIIDIDTIASAHGMAVRDITIGEVPTQGDAGEFGADSSTLGSITLSFKVAGSYETFRAFLSDLENSLRIVDMESITFSAANDTEDFNEYELTIRTYWLE